LSITKWQVRRDEIGDIMNKLTGIHPINENTMDNDITKIAKDILYLKDLKSSKNAMLAIKTIKKGLEAAYIAGMKIKDK